MHIGVAKAKNNQKQHTLATTIFFNILAVSLQTLYPTLSEDNNIAWQSL